MKLAVIFLWPFAPLLVAILFLIPELRREACQYFQSWHWLLWSARWGSWCHAVFS